MKRVSRFLFTSLLALSLASAAALAQISQGGTPISFQITEKVSLNDVPFETMPTIDVEKLRAEDVIVDQHKDIPWRFGENIEVDFNIYNSGTWDYLPDGAKIWRLGIESKGALSINLTFSSYRLPKGAELFIYSPDRKHLLGAFTDFNNQEDRLFATTLVLTDAIILEYYEPVKAEFAGELAISRVTHGYRGVWDFAKGLNTSGACNVNVVCPQSAGSEDQIRSVAMLVTGSSGFCTGALINNTNNDGTPYFLSADHCYTTPGTVVYWFNWQSATCTNPSSSPAYNSVSGATDKARNATSDFWLTQLNSTPPANYNVYYAGWNRTTDNNIAGRIVGIHHPDGDIKKISWSTLGVSTTTYLQNPVPGDGSHWRITSWSDGTTTEGGSSGSPLFDPEGRIIGQLHGGYAACGNTTSDWYGKLGVSWTGGGTNATRLSNWLDPTSSGVTAIAGYDPNAIVVAVDAQLLSVTAPVASYQAPQSIIPAVVIKNKGTDNLTAATVSYTLNGGTAVEVAWTGNLASNATETVNFPSIDIIAGSHVFVATITATGDENATNNSKTVNFTVYNCGAPVALPFNEGFSATTLPGCWQNVDNQGSGQVWQFGTHTSGLSGATGNYAYLNSDAYGSGNSQNADLVTPRFDFSGYTNVTLSFTHYFRSYTGSSAKLFYSINGGTNWTQIQAWTANTTNPASFNQVIAAVAGESNVKFKWNFTGTWAYYWDIENVQVTGTPAGTYANFTGTPTAIEVGQSVTFTDASGGGAITSWSWNFGEGASPATATGQGPHTVTYNTVGLKTVSLTINGDIVNTKTNYINVTPFCGDAITVYPHAESFEGAFTPTCWSLQSTSTNTWAPTTGYTISGTTPVTINPQEGSKFAYVQWIAQNQDEKLISPKFDFTGKIPTISFWFNGSYNWAITQPNCDLKLMVSVNDGAWTQAWTETDHPNFNSDAATYTWLNTQLQLDAYEGESNVRFMFNYIGNDGANFGIDNIVVDAITVATTYTITTTAGSGGNITPSGTVVVVEGNDKSFAITPSTGYYINDVLVDEVSVGAITEYTFTNVVENHTIAASFTPNNYTLTIEVIGSGNVTVGGIDYITPVEFTYGEIASIEAVAQDGWEFTDWSGDVVSTLVAESVTMDGNKSITATFTEVTSINPSVLSNLRVYPNPFNEKIILTNVANVKVVSFTNILGQKVAEFALNGEASTSISTSNIAKGIYFVTFQSQNGEKVVKKLIKD